MKKNIFLLLCCFALTGLFTAEAEAQSSDLNIGYVDPQSIMMSMPEMAAIERRLQNFVERKREEFTQKETDFRRQVEEYQEKLAVISEAAQRQEEERLAELNLELQEFQTNFQVEVQERQAELIGPLLDKIQDAIDQVASSRNLTYVLNTVTNNGDFIILYASEEAQQNYDITEEVKQVLDI
ncbi:MAG: OmpH family outer membrane protein [Balneolales bacterium]